MGGRAEELPRPLQAHCSPISTCSQTGGSFTSLFWIKPQYSFLKSLNSTLTILILSVKSFCSPSSTLLSGPAPQLLSGPTPQVSLHWNHHPSISPKFLPRPSSPPSLLVSVPQRPYSQAHPSISSLPGLNRTLRAPRPHAYLSTAPPTDLTGPVFFPSTIGPTPCSPAPDVSLAPACLPKRPPVPVHEAEVISSGVRWLQRAALWAEEPVPPHGAPWAAAVPTLGGTASRHKRSIAA